MCPTLAELIAMMVFTYCEGFCLSVTNENGAISGRQLQPFAFLCTAPSSPFLAKDGLTACLRL